MVNHFESLIAELQPVDDLDYATVLAAASAEFLSNATNEVIVPLTKSAYGLGDARSSTRRELAQAIQDVDSTFVAEASDKEVQVLAAVCVAETIENRTKWLADTAALAVQCIDFQGNRARPRLTELLRISAAHLRDRAVSIRDQSDWAIKVSPVESTISNKIGVLKTALDTNDFPRINVPLIDLANSLNTALSSLLAATNNANRSIMNNVLYSREESNIFWWMFGGVSRDLNKKFSTLKLAESTMRVPKELFDLIQAVPGPVSSSAFIEYLFTQKRAITPISLKDLANHFDESTRREWIGDGWSNELKDVTPITAALHASLQTDDPDNWTPVYSKDSETDPEASFKSKDLAKQYYNELCLLKAIEAGSST